MNASSASLVKAFVELDPYKKLGVYKSLQGYRWQPLKDPDLLYAPRVTFAILALDKTDGLPLRMKTRDEHLAYMRQSTRVVTAGPLRTLDDEDGAPVGSLVIFNAEDQVKEEEEEEEEEKESLCVHYHLTCTRRSLTHTHPLTHLPTQTGGSHGVRQE